MIRLFLCKARERKRSIVSLCEDFVIRRLVQKELIRTILFFKKIVIPLHPHINLLYRVILQNCGKTQGIRTAVTDYGSGIAAIMLNGN